MSKRKDHKGKILQPGEYQRKNGTYEYRWMDQPGKRNSVYAQTLTELRELEEMIIARSQRFHCPSSMTFDDLYNLWLASKQGIKDSTKTMYMNMYDNHVKGSKMQLQNMRLMDISKSTMRQFFGDACEDGSLSSASINNLYLFIQQVFKLAVEDDMIAKNPATGAAKEYIARAKKAEGCKNDKAVKALTTEEQSCFFSFFKKRYPSPQYWICRLMLLTGMRVGEALALQWEDIDFMRAQLRISHNLSERIVVDGKTYQFRLTTPKNGSSRIVPLCDEAVELLQDVLAFDRAMGLQVDEDPDGFKNYVFVTTQRKPFWRGSVNTTIGWIVKEYNETHTRQLPSISSHWFRHTFATRMFEANVQPKTVQELLGHADYRMTMNVYTSVLGDIKRDAMSKFAEHIATT